MTARDDTQTGRQGDEPPVDRTPLHLRTSLTIERRILEGIYPVGALLPTEIALSDAFGVSRQTVRQAIARLRAAGLLEARKGVGTRVCARERSRGPRFVAQSRDELSEFAGISELRIDRRETLAARGALATELGCRSGRRWLHMRGVRYVDGDTRPLAYGEVYLDPRAGPALRDRAVFREAIFALVEESLGERIETIEQAIAPVILDAAVADRLEAAPDTLALKITRRYFGAGRRLLQMSHQTVPADRHVHTTLLRGADTAADAP